MNDLWVRVLKHPVRLDSPDTELACSAWGEVMIRGITLVVASLWISQAAQGDPETVARFRAEYPTAAKRLQERFTQVKGDYRIEDWKPSKSRRPRITSGEFAVSGTREKVSFRLTFSENFSSDDPGTVYCVGEDYAFQLSRLSKDTYRVSGIEKRTEKSSYNNVFGKYLKAPYARAGFPLVGLMTNPGFRIDDAETMDQDGRSVIKVKCALSRGIPEIMEFTFQPDAGWRIVESRDRIANHESIMKVEYDQADGSNLYPKRVSWRQGNDRMAVATFKNISEFSTPAVEFTMPFFGLPDLVSNTGSSHHLVKSVLFWGAVAGFVLAGVLVAISRYGRPYAR